MAPKPALIERFQRDLDAVIAPDARIGVAVSGGPDSMALLLLAAAARPGRVEAATVDHALRTEAREEAEAVSTACHRLGVYHDTLTIAWNERPETALQERARTERYALLAGWARDRRLAAIVTAHHADDQAETLLMRLARGAGVRGLAGMRAVSVIPGSDVPLLRPLLGWHRRELEAVCADAGIAPADDASNRDPRFERVRVRKALAESDELDPAALARSAAWLAHADVALDWATDIEWRRSVRCGEAAIIYRRDGAPPEIERRILERAIRLLGQEGPETLRGAEIDGVITALGIGEAATLRGVACRAKGEVWHFMPAPLRRH